MENIDRKLIGDRIKERRKSVGLTQEELGDKIGKTFATVAKYENGLIKNIDAMIISKIADITNTDIDYLLLKSNIPNPVNAPIQIAASTKNNIDLSKICEEDKQTILKIYNILKNKSKN